MKKTPQALWWLLVAILVAAALTWWRTHRKDPAADSLAGKEQCLSCHRITSGFAGAHRSVKCTGCHLGNPEATGRQEAHSGLVRIPGNLSDAQRTCSTAQCHPGINARVHLSLMNTMSGVLSTNRLAFGEKRDSTLSPATLSGSTADHYARRLCISCHLGNEKTSSGPIGQQSRGGGCLACHLNYDSLTTKAHLAYVVDGRKNPPAFHPSISLQVSDDHCFGCHSRSGRISTSYEGWHETLLDMQSIPDTGKYRLLDDGRVMRFIAPDLHHELGLACIDCHGSSEVMGDGNRYTAKHQVPLVQCSDCHFVRRPRTRPFDSLSEDTKRLIVARGIPTEGKEFVVAAKGMELSNVFLESGRPVLEGKLNHRRYELSSPAPDCLTSAHQALSCNSCHARWAPKCIDCHISFDKQNERWIEQKGRFLAAAPTLGVSTLHGQRKIVPVVPGMILSIDTASATIHRRWFARLSPHTTARKGRGCKSCHDNPDALGYGAGRFDWHHGMKFIPALAGNEKLPADAWILPGQTAKQGQLSAWDHLRPFTAKEQARLLEVGRCLQCHEPQSEVMQRALSDFAKVKKDQKTPCRRGGMKKLRN